MDTVKENIVKFIDCIIEEDYSKAHSFLEVVVNEKMKGLIKEALKKKTPKKESKKSAIVSGAKEAGEKSAFSKKELPKEKLKHTKGVSKPKNK